MRESDSGAFLNQLFGLEGKVAVVNGGINCNKIPLRHREISSVPIPTREWIGRAFSVWGATIAKSDFEKTLGMDV